MTMLFLLEKLTAIFRLDWRLAGAEKPIQMKPKPVLSSLVTWLCIQAAWGL